MKGSKESKPKEQPHIKAYRRSSGAGRHNVLIISDQHAPFHHPDTLDFLRDTYHKYKCTKVVNIGDEMDFHAISRHMKEADAMGAEDEFKEGMKFMRSLYKLFPNVSVCTSNHTARPYRRAKEVGLPERFLKSYKQFMEAPDGWEWRDSFLIDQVHYSHGEETSGKDGAINLAMAKRTSCAIGHLHSWAGAKYHANEYDIIFGLNSGCLIDVNAYAFRYGRPFKHKPTVGCGVVIEGATALFEPMDLGSKVMRAA